MSAHSRLSPSAAHRWMSCPGSIVLEERIPQRGSTDYQDEGSAAHALAQIVLMNGTMQTSDMIDRTIQVREDLRWTVDEEMATEVQKYVDFVRALPGQRLIEQRLDFSDVVEVPDSFGTGDAVVFSDILDVVDLKYGKGVRVTAEGNEQMYLYAIAALDQYQALGPFERVRVTVHQPRLDHVSTYEVPTEELLAFERRLRPVAQGIADGSALDMLSPGEKQCHWCRAKPICPALRAQVDEQLTISFADLLTGSDADLGEAMGKIDLLETWAKSVKEEVNRRLMEGGHVPGWKLVEGRRGNREWTDTNAVADALAQTNVPAEEVFTTSMNSPAKIEKALKKYSPNALDTVMCYTTQSPGKPSVAPASDKRQEYHPAATASDFLN